MKVYGYVRCSTKEQNPDRQIISMLEFGVPEKNIVTEMMSGKNFIRPLYRKLVKKLKPGDTLVIKSVDRLGRNYQEIINEWRYITKEREAALVVLDMPILDTREKELNITGTFIADLVLQILSYMAEMERSFNTQRQAEGISAAMAKGIKFGREPKERSETYEVLRDSWYKEEISARAAGRILGISHTTFLIWAREELMMTDDELRSKR